MAIAQPTKREIKIIANQRKEIELDSVGIVNSLHAEGIFIFKKMKTKSKMHGFLLLITQPQNITFRSFASN